MFLKKNIFILLSTNFCQKSEQFEEIKPQQTIFDIINNLISASLKPYFSGRFLVMFELIHLMKCFPTDSWTGKWTV